MTTERAQKPPRHSTRGRCAPAAGARAERRLGSADWVTGALELVCDEGVDALGVEPLARRMGTTKGSFYWHFADRAQLLDAVLEHWRLECTQRIIEHTDERPDAERLAALVTTTMIEGPDAVLEWALHAAAGHPQVGPVVDEVNAMRIDYLARLFRAHGLPAARARARARVAYAAYLGNLQLVSRAGHKPDARAMRGFRAEVLALVQAP